MGLTDIWGTNSLWLESAPGSEDWHAIQASYGRLKRFWGGSCTHFTVTNTTPSSRVSLDFRCVVGTCFETESNQYINDPDYFFLCERDPATGQFKVRSPPGRPTALVGFPFTDVKS